MRSFEEGKEGAQLLKRMITIMLSLLLLAAVLPVSAAAETTEELCTRIEEDYQKALEGTGKTTLGGHCGELASWQMYFNGINTYVLGNDGNKYYDQYRDMQTTIGGYHTEAYGAEEYTLEQALNEVTKNGLNDVYNIMVGFEWTNTEAGATYGHAVFVYAIIDGIMYFTESFDTSMGTKEGEAIKTTIPQFVDYYDDWTVFDGIIVFGQYGNEYDCKQYASDMYAEATAETSIVSRPCQVNEKGTACKTLRTAEQGERLLVTGLLENASGQFYYRVDDNGEVGYVAPQTVKPVHFKYTITLQEPLAPQILECGKDFAVGGVIAAKQNTMGVIRIEVTDINNQVVLNYMHEGKCGLFNLNDAMFNELVDFSVLDSGHYYYEIYVDNINYYVRDGKLETELQRICLLKQSFKVGKKLLDSTTASTRRSETRQGISGWYWEQGNWHYYENGMPKTGWFSYQGEDYYLQEDSSMTNGLTKIDGKWYFFTHTGAMCTGWLDTGKGTYYLQEDGAAATGWKTIDEKKYFFDLDGILLRDCWLSQGKDTYYLQSDGSAAVGIIRLPEGYFNFQMDGRLRTANTEVNDLATLPEGA